MSYFEAIEMHLFSGSAPSVFHDMRVHPVLHARPVATQLAASRIGGRAENELFVLALATSAAIHRFVKRFAEGEINEDTWVMLSSGRRCCLTSPSLARIFHEAT